MYGRHVDIEKVEAEWVELTNKLSGLNKVKNIGVWGRSEQIMAINGEEIRIGPSGYYELKDYEYIESLCVANIDSDDKYIIDAQYEVTK